MTSFRSTLVLAAVLSLGLAGCGAPASEPSSEGAELEIEFQITESAQSEQPFPFHELSLRLGEQQFVPVEDDGEATFKALPPGAHEIHLVAPEQMTLATEPSFPLPVEVTPGADMETRVLITGFVLAPDPAHE